MTFPRWLAIGFALGITVGLAISALLVVGRIDQIATLATTTARVAATETMAFRATATAVAFRVQPTATQSIDEILMWGERELKSHGENPQLVIERLAPLLSQVEREEDRIRIYEILAEAETWIGHPQRAAAYYELVFEARQDPDLLLKIAIAHDLGGNFAHAWEYYRKYIEWPGGMDGTWIEMAEKRAEEIHDILSSLSTASPQ